MDEETGRLTGFDVTKETQLNPLDLVYGPKSGPLAALQLPDPKARKAEMDRILDLAHLARRLDKTTTPTRVIGKAAHSRYNT